MSKKIKDASAKLAAMLDGAAKTAPAEGQAAKPSAPKTPIASAKAPASKTGKASKIASAPRRAAVAASKLPVAVAKKLAKATDKQRKTIGRILGYDPNAAIAAPDKDGDIVVRYVPAWEQGRVKGGVFAKGPSRQFVYLVDKNGELSGHGYRYRSSAAEAKLKPLEETNAKRIEREAKKIAKAA